MSSPPSRRRLVLGLFCALLFAPLASADSLRFALVAKTIDHPPFIQAGKGCAEAARAEGDSCILLGPSGSAHFRQQDRILGEALGMGLDGIAVSVTRSHWLAEHSLQRAGQTPLITFDADLEPADQHLRRAYVGYDDRKFGHRLGRLAQRIRPQGGQLCLLAGSLHDTNIDMRIQGVRDYLGGAQGVGPSGHLSGASGWREHARCPLYSSGNQEVALRQLATILDSASIDLIISMGSWPVSDPEKFRKDAGPLLAEHQARGTRPAIVIGIGEPSAEQLALLDEGLVQAYLAVSFRELGRQSYWVLKRLAQGKPVPRTTLLESRVYLPE